MIQIPMPKDDGLSRILLKRVLFRLRFKEHLLLPHKNLNGNKNYLNWYASVQLWFLDQRLSDHLTKKVSKIDASIKDDWESVDYQLVSLLWNSTESKLMAHFRLYKTCY